MKKITTLVSCVAFMVLASLGYGQDTLVGETKMVKSAMNGNIVSGVQPNTGTDVRARGFLQTPSGNSIDTIVLLDFQRPGGTQVSPPPTGNVGSALETVTANHNLQIAGITKVTGVSGTRSWFKKTITGQVLVQSVYRGGFDALFDMTTKSYASISYISGFKIGTGNDGQTNSLPISFTPGMSNSIVLIVDNSANSTSMAGKTWFKYLDSTMRIFEIDSLFNGDLLLTARDGSGTKTQFLRVDGANPVLAGNVPNVIADTTYNCPVSAKQLPNGNIAIVGCGETFITNTLFQVLENGYFKFPIGGPDSKIIPIDSSFIVSYPSVCDYVSNKSIGRYRKRTVINGDAFQTVAFVNDTAYTYRNFTQSGVNKTEYRKFYQGFDSSEMIYMHPSTNYTAFEYMERFNGTDSMVNSNEFIIYMKRNATDMATLAATGDGNILPVAFRSEIIAPSGWIVSQYIRLYLDSVTNEWYTYGIIQNGTLFTHTKQTYAKIIYTDDPLYITPPVIPNNPPVHSGTSQFLNDTLTLNKSFNFGGATDVDGDTLSYFANGLPPGKTINASTGVVSGIPTATGVFPVQCYVTDGTDTVLQNHTIRVSIRHYASLAEQEKQNATVFPNPAQDQVFIENIAVKSFSLYNTDGKLVLQGNSNKISVANLPKGLYQLVIVSKNDTQITKKLVVE